MEKKHKQRIIEKFIGEIINAEIVVLHIRDKYQYMAEDLIEELTAKVSNYL